MSKLTIATLIAAVALASPAWADDAHHPEKAAAVKAGPGAAASQPAQAVPKMQRNVKKMQAQLERIAKAPTDEARQKAIGEHMQTMHENMQMARGMQAGAMGCPMMDGTMMDKGGGMGMMGKGGGMGMMGASAPQDGAADPLQKMEKRMEMMQEMMKTMMERMPAPPAK